LCSINGGYGVPVPKEAHDDPALYVAWMASILLAIKLTRHFSKRR
jgi:hypothetical protein